MKRVAEIIHIVEAQREAFINSALNPDDEAQEVLWLCGVRSQQYFALGELIFMTFEYAGNDFKADMDRMAAYLDAKGNLVKMRRKDVPAQDRDNTNWWAPVKKLGTLFEETPRTKGFEAAKQADYMAMLDGYMPEYDRNNDISYDEDDWTEGMHI